MPILGNPKQRNAALNTKADIHIISRDNVRWLVDTCKNKWPYDTIVIDELSSFKNAGSIRFKSLRKVRPYVDRVIGLTGTPVPNSYIDLWSQIFLLDRGERLEKTLTKFRQKYCQTITRPTFTEYKIRPESVKEIDTAIADICISMSAKDYLQLPPVTYIDRPVVLTIKEKAAYEEMAREAVLEYRDKTIMAVNAAAVTNKLLQIANGCVYDEEGRANTIHDQKLDELEQLIEEAAGQPVLVYYSFRSDLARIKGRFPQARMLDTDQDIKDWNEGKIPIFLAHPASAGHGLNLQDGGSVIIWFGLTWSLELYQQANARLNRQGQKKPVRIYHIIAKDTIDERVLKVLQMKDNNQAALLDHVKAEIRKYEE